MAVWRTVVRIEYGAPGGPGYCTFHWRDAGAGAEFADLSDASAALQDAFETLLTPWPNSTRFIHDGIWQEIDGPREVDVAGWSLVGVGANQNVLPGNVAVCVGWRTADRGRSGRGRTFLSGLPTSASIDGTPNGTVLAACNAFGQSIVDWNSAALNGAFVVYSRTEGIARDITSRAVRDVFASLRSRRD